MAPEVKTTKNSKLPKLPENCFEPVGKGGWPPISTWINPYEIISIENDNISESLTPLDGSFPLSVVGNKEKQKEEELRRGVGETISMNNWALEYSRNINVSTQCSDIKKWKFSKLLGEFQKVFS
jgi:hypothetical protein